jgi:hypothetical protein
MSSTKAGSARVDEARQLICREFARMLSKGMLTVRVRIELVEKEPAEAWFYGETEDRWHKRPGGVKGRALVRAIEESLDALASRKHADEWSARRSASADWRDTQLHFHADKVEEWPARKIESALMGTLFRDAHASKKDVRRNIRTPVRGRPRK